MLVLLCSFSAVLLMLFAVDTVHAAQVSSCAHVVSTLSFNFEANATVDSLRLTVCDDGTPPLCTTTPPFSIGVLDVNEAPTLR